MGHEKQGQQRQKACMTARGFKQIAGIHFDPNDKAVPVVNMMNIRIFLVLWSTCFMWNAELVDVKGAFLRDLFEASETKAYLEVPQGSTTFMSN